MTDYLYILMTISFTVYGQIILKWRKKEYGDFPVTIIPKLIFLVTLIADPFIFSGFAAAFLAAMSWMAAMTKFEISFAYPFMSLNFVIVFIFSIVFISEAFTMGKMVGIIFIVTVLIIMVKQ